MQHMVPVDACELAELRAVVERARQVEAEPMPTVITDGGQAAALVAARWSVAKWIRTGRLY